MKTLIMAGGKGTRIAQVASDIPKPMIKVCGKPILEWQIENLKAFALTDITLVIGHLGGVIQDYFGDGSKFGVKISYFVETSPLGTAGALFKMCLEEDFLLLCADVVMDIDFERFIAFHKDHGAWATLLSHPNDHPFDSSLLVTRMDPPREKGGLPLDTHRVVRWLNKEDDRGYCKNRVNAGVEIISPRLLEAMAENYASCHRPLPSKIDLDRDVLKPNIGTACIFAYDTPEYIKDMGTPDRYWQVERDVQNGRVRARNLKNKQKTIFLDRDGTLTEYAGFVTHPDQLKLLPKTAEALRLINASGYLAIVITNQPVIARGECTFEQLDAIHCKMESELGKEGAFVDAIYVCPHHPDRGFAGERAEYKIDCDCRKPKPGLLLKAAEDFNIDLSASYMIGDGERDTRAGENAGVKKTFQIARNSSDELLTAVKGILDLG